MRRNYNEMTERLGDPDVTGDPKLLMSISQERSNLEEVVTAFSDWESLTSQMAEAQELFDMSDGDVEMREMSREEMKEIGSALTDLEDRMVVLTLPKDPYDNKNVMLEIRAGTGGGEANLFAGDLVGLYKKFAESEGWTVRVTDESLGDDGGFKSCVLEVTGNSVYSKMKFEAGVHRVQRVPATESQGRVHTSTATVAVMPEVDEVEVRTLHP